MVHKSFVKTYKEIVNLFKSYSLYKTTTSADYAECLLKSGKQIGIINQHSMPESKMWHLVLFDVPNNHIISSWDITNLTLKNNVLIIELENKSQIKIRLN